MENKIQVKNEPQESSDSESQSRLNYIFFLYVASGI
jgi:hypothetical protein